MPDVALAFLMGVLFTLAVLFPRGRSRMPSLAPEHDCWESWQAEQVRRRGRDG